MDSSKSNLAHGTRCSLAVLSQAAKAFEDLDVSVCCDNNINRRGDGDVRDPCLQRFPVHARLPARVTATRSRPNRVCDLQNQGSELRGRYGD